MERLTYVAENGEVLFHPADLPDDEGITITQLAKDGRYKALEEIAERLANREQAEEQGLLLRLPCKEAYSQSGDNVYLIYEDEIVECVHCGLSIDPVIGKGVIALATDEDIFPYRNPDPEHDLDPTDWCNNATDIEVREIGNTLFFTREEAEAKLKEMEGESDVL
jgi:hypothetical protein